MSDVVDRLRMWGMSSGEARGPNALELEAADEIIALRSRLEQHVKWRDDAQNAAIAAQKERDAALLRLGEVAKWLEDHQYDIGKTLADWLREVLVETPEAEFKEYPREPCCGVCGTTEHLKHPAVEKPSLDEKSERFGAMFDKVGAVERQSQK